MPATSSRPRSHSGHGGVTSGFSLIEVVIAVGILATGLVAVIGLFGPLATSAAALGDATAASRLGDALRVELGTRADRARSLAPIAELLKEHEALAGGGERDAVIDPRRDTRILFASRDCLTLGSYGDKRWRESDLEKFFVITLIRPDSRAAFAPPEPEPEATAAFLAFIVQVRWPAFAPRAGGAGSPAVAPTEPFQQETLLLTGSIGL
jgi:prepilin-type N-terminal cleavage/methylation domain-containing protein